MACLAGQSIATHLDDVLRMCVQYYDDAAGILRSIILSAIAPHRLSLPTMPMPAFSITPEQVKQRAALDLWKMQLHECCNCHAQMSPSPLHLQTI